jgi:shikimate dehydrogenase
MTGTHASIVSALELHRDGGIMLESLTGATRIYFVVGDPIKQVKSPNGITKAFTTRGHDAIVVPLHVSAADVDAFIVTTSRARNVDGLLATVPHKFAAYAHCVTASERAHVLSAANILRRNPDGTWHGDMLDGPGFVRGIRRAGFATLNQRVLLVGAGGAGSAIALELIQAGISMLAIHDSDTVRRDRLLWLMNTQGPVDLRVGSCDPTGFDLVVNATPAGMSANDALPVETDKLQSTTFVADVVTLPEVTPLLEAARTRGCRTATGVDMFRAELDLQLSFFLEAGPWAF